MWHVTLLGQGLQLAFKADTDNNFGGYDEKIPVCQFLCTTIIIK